VSAGLEDEGLVVMVSHWELISVFREPRRVVGIGTRRWLSW